MKELMGIRVPFGTTDNVGPGKGNCPGFNSGKPCRGMTYDYEYCWEYDDDGETTLKCPFLDHWETVVEEHCKIFCTFEED